jgi:hypothetical protein
MISPAANPFARDKDLFAPLLIRERILMGLFATTAVVGCFAPVMWSSQKNEVKLLQQIYGLFAGTCFTAAAYHRKQKEQTYQAISEANYKIVNEHLKGVFAYEASRQQIESKRELAEYVNSLPSYERERWMNQYGLHGLVELPQFQEAEILPQPQLSGMEIPNPDIAAINEDTVQSIINPDAMQVLHQYAAQYPQYIRLDDHWIDELCGAASNPDMKSRYNHHFMLVGGTQSGKSTLAGVIVNKIASRSQSPAIVLGSDPKDQVTRWLCKFSRKFDGMKALDSWISFATEIIQQRKDQIGGNNGTEGIAEIFFLQDEVDTCYGGGNGFPGMVEKTTAKNLQALWNYIAKFTAGLKCHGIFMGQSPLSEATGFSRPNLKNICFMALGQLSSYILGKPTDFLNVKPEIIDLLKEVCSLLDDAHVRYALVVPTRGNPYVALIPTFDIEGLEQKSTTKNQPGTIDAVNWYEELQTWFNSLGRQPSDQELQEQWEKITGKTLNAKGIALLQEKLAGKT